jgi:HupE / UreJ protein
MKKAIATAALIFQVLFTSAHPMPNTLIGLSVAKERLVFVINIPISDVETAVFQTADAVSKSLPSAVVLENYFSKHLKIKGIDGISWQCQMVSIDTLEAIDAAVGKFIELKLTLHATPPQGADLRRFLLYYDAILHQIVTHQAILNVRQDWDNGVHAEDTNPTVQSLAVIQVESKTGEILPVAVNLESGSIWKGFVAMFRLGMKHIAEGYDHLLFLLVLLLPAPLLWEERRWGGFGGWKYSFWRLLKIVTAFTIGHSLTLAAAALGWLRLPTQPVEVVIALSILFSAVHALRPVFSGRETWVAVGFGLVHGLAFASILSNLNLDSSRLTLSILGFNLGIEAMQLAVVAVVLPVLAFLSTTKYYTYVRVGGAAFSIGLAVVWVVERVRDLGL